MQLRHEVLLLILGHVVGIAVLDVNVLTELFHLLSKAVYLETETFSILLLIGQR